MDSLDRRNHLSHCRTAICVLRAQSWSLPRDRAKRAIFRAQWSFVVVIHTRSLNYNNFNCIKCKWKLKKTIKGTVNRWNLKTHSDLYLPDYYTLFGLFLNKICCKVVTLRSRAQSKWVWESASLHFPFDNIEIGRVLRGKKRNFWAEFEENPSHIPISRAHKFTIHINSNTFFKTTQNLY